MNASAYIKFGIKDLMYLSNNKFSFINAVPFEFWQCLGAIFPFLHNSFHYHIISPPSTQFGYPISVATRLILKSISEVVDLLSYMLICITAV